MVSGWSGCPAETLVQSWYLQSMEFHCFEAGNGSGRSRNPRVPKMRSRAPQEHPRALRGNLLLVWGNTHTSARFDLEHWHC